MNSDRRWETIYTNVITEGRRIQRKRAITAGVSLAFAVAVVLVSVLFYTRAIEHPDTETMLAEQRLDAEVVMLASGILYDDALGMLEEE